MNWSSRLPLAVAALLALAGHQPAPPAVWQLAPAIAPAPPARVARGGFLSRSQSLVLPGGTLWLASTPDGRGELCSDDRATVSVQDTQQIVWRWSHVFASADRQGITCVEPQAVPIPSAGTYTVTITLEDLFSDTYSSRPYVLVFAGSGESAPAATALPQPQAMPAPTHAAPVPTNAPATAIPSPAPPARATVSERKEQPQPISMIWLGGAALALVLVLLLARRIRRRNAAPHAQAILDLFDQETREARTLALPAGTALIARHPLRIVSQTAASDAAAQVGRVQLVAGGAQLSFPGMPQRAPIVLHPAQRYELAGGAVVLRYRGPAPSTPDRSAALPKRRPR